MRDLVFKNLTSKRKDRKIIAAKEMINENGIRTVIKKHLICLINIKEQSDAANRDIKQGLYITKEKHTCTKTESFFVKMKGKMIACNNGKMFEIDFLHSLRIELSPTAEQKAS